MINILKTNELVGHAAAIYALCQEDEPYVLSGGVDRNVIRWDLKNPENSKVLIKASESIYSLCYYADKQLLFIGTSSGMIHIIDLAERKELKLLQTHHDRVFDLKIHQDTLLSTSADGCIAFTNLQSLTTEKIVQASPETIRSIDCKNDAAVIACGDATIKLLDLNERRITSAFNAHEKSANVVKFHPTKNVLLSGGWDAHLKIWDADYNLVKSIPAHNYAIYSIVFSADNAMFATASRDRSIKIWDASNPEFPTSITQEKHGGHRYSVNKLIWLANGGLLISASDDRKLISWKIT